MRTIAWFVSTLPWLGSALLCACPSLNPDQRLRAVIPPGGAACFAVSVPEDDASQMSLEQQGDMEILLKAANSERRIDSFEFGRETLTLTVAGQYQLEVRMVSPSRVPIMFIMSRSVLPLQDAMAWERAELTATKAKQTGEPADIAVSLEQWHALGATSAVGRTHLKQAEHDFDVDDSSARKSYEAALALCKAARDFQCVGDAANNMGVIARRFGDLTEAILRSKEAADIWRTTSQPIFEAQAISNLGLTAWQAGDLQGAIGYYDRAAAVLRGKDAVAHARVVNNLGLCYLSLAEYGKAAIQFQRALTVFVQHQRTREEVRTLLNQGRVYLLAGRFDLAQRVLTGALAKARAHADRNATADILNNLGQLFWRRHLIDPAEERFDEALTLDRAIGDKRAIAYDLHYLGLIAQEQGATGAARQFLEDALRIRRDCGLREDSTESLLALATLERTAGNLPRARDLTEEALRVLESVRSQVPGAALRASYYSRKRSFFDLLVELAMDPGNPNAAADGLLAAERGRGRALLDLLADGSLLRQLPPDLAQRRSDIQRRLDLLSAQLASAPLAREAELRGRVQLLLSEDGEVEARIRESIAQQPLGQPLRTVDELQHNLLPPATALLEYHLGEGGSFLWLVDRNQLRVFSLPPRSVVEAQAKAAVARFSGLLERRRSPQQQTEFLRSLRVLSSTLLGALKDVPLPVNLILVPDGILNRVPFAGLRQPGVAEALGLVHDLSQIPSAAYLAAGRKPRPISAFPKTILALADPVFAAEEAKGLARLPFTGELDIIESLVPPGRRAILRRGDANRNALQQQRMQDFAILHLSTHALIDDSIPEMSRIALSVVDRAGHPVDGFLRPYQLGRLRLSGSVVVLSACDTALGKQVSGEGMLGLTSSLFYAGASQLVLTLVKVDGEASSEFLGEVYRHLLAARPATVEHALTLARRTMAASSRWSDPYHWASFIVVGRPMDAH